MGSRCEVEPTLVRGVPAYRWFWLAFVGLLGAPALAIAVNRVADNMPKAFGAVGTACVVALMTLTFVSFCMLYLQRRREYAAGYTTLWTDEDQRALDEVGPSTGLIIREAGDDPLTKPQRRHARAEAKARARQLQASDTPYTLPFGWRTPRRRQRQGGPRGIKGVTEAAHDE